MRIAATLLSALLLAFAVAPGALADVSVYLERDSQGRYLPTVENDGPKRVLGNIDSMTAPALHLDSARVAFSGAVGNGSLGRFAIFVVDLSGANLTQLTDGEFGEFDPVWVDGGDAVVFSQNSSGAIRGSCCRLASVDVSSGNVETLTPTNGAQRPAAVPDGNYVFYDTSAGVWRMPQGGGSSTLIASAGYDAAVSADESEVVFLRRTGATNVQIRRVSAGGGSSAVLYSTANEIENPVWIDGRIYFLEHAGLGYDGRKSVRVRSVSRTGGPARTEQNLSSGVVGLTPGKNADELLFYNNDGEYAYYSIRSNAELGRPVRAGDDYTTDWSSITSVDLDGDSDDEMFFYRSDGLYRYYEIRADAGLGAPVRAGEDYTSGWDSVTAVDLDGDGQDEMFFYRSDGLYRYYDIRPNGRIGSPIRAGDDYTTGWDSITAVDLNGDGQDEMFFYRGDGLYRYYDIRPNGRIGSPIRAGDDYTTDWSSITAVDIDADRQDEMLFYRTDGLYRYYHINANAVLGSPISAGSNYETDWSNITAVQLPTS